MKIKLSIVSGFICLVVLFSLTGCLSIKPGGKKSGKSYFETFYVGEGGTQYFIKPIVFSSIKKSEKINFDFTFKYKNEVKDSANVNFSILSNNMFKNIDSLTFKNTTHNFVIKDFKLLFNERNSKLFDSRFSTKISLKDLNKMFNSADWVIDVFKENVHYTYTTEKRTKKVIEKLQDKIFVLFQ